ncbi:MAG: hypothetical protein V3S14_10160 [Anaerolineae bacterium]
MLSLFTASTNSQEMYQRVLRNGYLDGALVALASLDDPLIPDLLRDQMVFVSIGRYPNEQVHYVSA